MTRWPHDRKIAPWIFVTRKGKPYTDDAGVANAFDLLWQRFMVKVIKDTKITDTRSWSTSS
ncbi:MAG: hypothetical protein OEN20_00905 [Gammaproteobacteria bacterium]|nr:hypothetical protein [Gammaproteobacteria bacterium]